MDLPAKQESKERYFLSLNRYERKKNIGLALHAFQQVCSSDAALRLKIAGGYDKEVA